MRQLDALFVKTGTMDSNVPGSKWFRTKEMVINAWRAILGIFKLSTLVKINLNLQISQLVYNF